METQLPPRSRRRLRLKLLHLRTWHRSGLGCRSGCQDAAFTVYVRSKVKTCGELGITSYDADSPESVTTAVHAAIIDDSQQT